MSDNIKIPAPIDRADERVSHAVGLGGVVRAFLDRVRSGDLGSLPVVVGLAVIWSVFTALNPLFVSSVNLVNLLFEFLDRGSHFARHRLHPDGR